MTDFQYTYNAVGNRTQKETPDLTETYEYDRADQLVEVLRTGTGTNRWNYAYDPAGNRTTEQVGDAPLQASFDNMNRLLSTSAGGALAFKGTLNEPAAVTIQGKPAEVDSTNKFEGVVNSTSGTNTVTVVATDPNNNTRTNTYEVEVSGDGVTYDYDASGNLIEKDDGTDTWTYEWNAENQLKKVLKNAATIATFAYDPLGRRVEKVVGATTTAFTYDGEDILRETAGATTTYYVHGPGIDEPLAKEITGSLTYYHADGLGSVLKMTNAAGSVTHEYRYDAYGRIEAGSTQGGFSFTGREWDPESGLFYYRARYFDPAMGRFISEDPIGFAGGLNHYTYVENKPLLFRDPFGLRPPLSESIQEAVGLAMMLAGACKSPFVRDVDNPVSNYLDEAMASVSPDERAALLLLTIKGPKVPIPVLDRTGKVHGDLPDHVSDDWTRRDLEDAADHLESSIRTRQNEQARLGEHGPHRARIGQEQQLLRYVLKILSGS